jgi:hypothetical protein
VIKLTVFNPGGPSNPGGSGQEELQAATYGRGVWQTALVSTQTTATLAPSALTFGAQALSTVSAAQPVTLSNTGTLPLTVSRITVSTDYTETDNCQGAIAAAASCTLQVSFTPSVLGARPGTLIVFANVPGGQLTTALSGSGVAGASVVPLPASLSFGGYGVGTASPSQVVTISNTGGITVSLTSESVSGDFQIVTNTCGPTLAPNTGCAVAITFTPTVAGPRTGGLTIVDGVGIQTVPLSGLVCPRPRTCLTRRH